MIEVIAIDVLANPFTTGIRIGKGSISRIGRDLRPIFYSKFADKSANKYLFDWWQDDLKIIVPPQKKKAEAPKQQELTGNSVSKKKKAEPPKQEKTALQKRRRPRLRSVY